MRQTILILSCALFSVAGCGDDTTKSSGGDLSVNAAADMTAGPDLAPRVPNGVVCGSMTCAVGQDCCIATANNAVTGETCVATASACTTGSTLACDGPEDCTSANPACCATLDISGLGGLTGGGGGGDADAGTLSVSGGNASCAGTCSFGFGTGSITTKLCHVDTDCSGETALGTATKCCSTSTAPGLHFCAVAIGPITCP